MPSRISRPSSRLALALGLMATVSLATACDTPGAGQRSSRAPRASDEPFQGITVVPVDIRFSGPAAKRYGERIPHAATPTEAAVSKTLASMGLRSDPALHRAARELAATAPDGANVPSGLMDAVMGWAGLIDPPPRLVVVEMPEDPAGCFARYTAACDSAVRSLAEKIQLRPGAVPARFGVGVVGLAGGRTRMIAAVLEPMVQLESLPTAVGLGRNVRIRGRLIGARRAPQVEVVDVNGRGYSAPTAVSVDGTFTAQVACGRDQGRMQVEVMAEGTHGPEVAANFPVYCGVRAPAGVRVEMERLASGVGADQIARANFEHLNVERKRRGLAPLAWDERAARVAQAHSKDMARNGFVGHVSPRTGGVTDRFETSNIIGAVIRENVARGYGPKGIHESLMSSPGHRVNMLATDVTHVGIGVVLGPPDAEVPQAPRPVFCTQNFFKKPGAGAPADKQLAPTIERRVDTQRKRAGLGRARWDPGLDAVAAQVAARVAAGRRLESGWEQEVFDLGYESVETHQVSSVDFDALHTVDVFGAEVLMAGIGVVRASERRGGAFVMVILVAER